MVSTPDHTDQLEIRQILQPGTIHVVARVQGQQVKAPGGQDRWSRHIDDVLPHLPQHALEVPLAVDVRTNFVEVFPLRAVKPVGVLVVAAIEYSEVSHILFSGHLLL